MKHTLLFTGHMIDARDRTAPRFPEEKENAARGDLKKVLNKERKNHPDQLTGIAGGASGGDILFHELCKETGIPSEVYLALPKEDFKKASVSFAGKAWVTRFEKLTGKLPVHILSEATGNKRSIWERINLWMLEEALKGGGEHMTLIALWDGKGGEGEGGTEHMVRVAKEAGAKTIIIDTKKL